MRKRFLLSSVFLFGLLAALILSSCAPKGEKDLGSKAKVENVFGGEVYDNAIYIEVPVSTEAYDLSRRVEVSTGANWNLYHDENGQNLIESKAVTLQDGNNIFYIKVISGNGEARNTYNLTIFRNYLVTVTYKSDGVVFLTREVERNTILSEGPSMTKEGYTFGGWGASGSVITENKEFNATWTANTYTITLDPRAGTVFPATKNVTFGAAFSLPEPAREGYIFTGWYTGSTGGTQITDADGKSLAVWSTANSVKLYARWVHPSHTVTLTKNIGVAGDVTGGGLKEETTSVTLSSTTRAGYAWLGWFADDELLSDKRSIILTMPAFDVTLEARWRANDYAVTLNSLGGILEETEALKTFGQTFALPVPKKTYYIFTGWLTENETKYTDADGHGLTVWNIPSEATLHASWITNTSDEFIIDRQDLASMELDGSYTLVFDINLAGLEWEPIGPFTGVLDGDGHKITNFKFGRSENPGIFASNAGIIKNLGLENFNVSLRAFENFGALAANNSGQIINCHAIGTVSATLPSDYASIGGLVGVNSGTIVGSFASVSFTARSINKGAYIGGLCGQNNGGGEIVLSYSAGNITVISSPTVKAGGFAGYNAGRIYNSYETGNVGVSTTTGSAAAYSFVAEGEGAVANCFAAGSAIANSSQSVSSAGTISNLSNNYYASGITVTAQTVKLYGTETSIENFKSNTWITDNLWKNNDTELWSLTPGVLPVIKPNAAELYAEVIDLSSSNLASIDGSIRKYRLTESVGLEGAEWNPLAFSGDLEGCGHVVSNYKITAGAVYAGFFSYLSGDVRNFGVKDFAIDFTINAASEIYAGGMAGILEYGGTIVNSSASGSIKIVNYRNTALFAGGFIGKTSGEAANSYSLAEVTARAASSQGSVYAGGFAGYKENGTLTNCYAVGNVSASAILWGNAYAGGFAGEIDLPVSYCVFTGNAAASTPEGLSFINNSGTEASPEELRDETFLTETALFGKYVSAEDLEINANNVWIFEENEFPKLYWEV
jgi:Listeria/Bacterioides repeat